jgi:hypothetical protein
MEQQGLELRVALIQEINRVIFVSQDKHGFLAVETWAFVITISMWGRGEWGTIGIIFSTSQAPPKLRGPRTRFA